MTDEYKFWMWFIGCVSIVTVVGISSLTYYKIEELDISIKLANNGISPAVATCLKLDWERTGTHDICKEVLTNSNLTIDEAKKMMLNLKEK